MVFAGLKKEKDRKSECRGFWPYAWSRPCFLCRSRFCLLGRRFLCARLALVPVARVSSSVASDGAAADTGHAFLRHARLCPLRCRPHRIHEGSHRISLCARLPVLRHERRDSPQRLFPPSPVPLFPLTTPSLPPPPHNCFFRFAFSLKKRSTIQIQTLSTHARGSAGGREPPGYSESPSCCQGRASTPRPV